MPAPLTIRPATERDIPFILACEASPASAFVQGNDEATHQANLADSAFTYLIAEGECAEALGYAMLVTSDADRAEWRRIIVDKPGKGIGKIFMRSVINKMFANGTSAIWLDVFEDNERARHVYKSLGFLETHLEPAPNNPERNLVFMELKRP